MQQSGDDGDDDGDDENGARSNGRMTHFKVLRQCHVTVTVFHITFLQTLIL